MTTADTRKGLVKRLAEACFGLEARLAAAWASGAHKRLMLAQGVTFVLADIRTRMPEGSFDNVVWDAAIEHFTPDEIAQIMAGIKRRLTPAGVLSGYSIVERQDGTKHIHQHEYEFRSKEDLLRFLMPHFRNVKVFETIFPSRHNLYFGRPMPRCRSTTRGRRWSRPASN